MRALAPATSIEEFERSPIGQYFLGESFVVWMYGPTLAGYVFFGPVDDRDVPRIRHCLGLYNHPAVEPPVDFLFDVAAFSGLSTAAFELVLENLRVVVAAPERLHRMAVVRPDGIPGAIVCGVFHQLLQDRIDAALFGERALAMRWLANPDGDAAFAALDHVLEDANLTVLRQLRRYLAANLRDPSLPQAAHQVQLSTRSLQRQLLSASTSFREEVERARIRAAEALLTESDAKLEAIAFELGITSAGHFSRMFRRCTGEDPRAFRERRRRSESRG